MPMVEAWQAVGEREEAAGGRRGGAGQDRAVE